MQISFGTLCTGIDAAAEAAKGTPFHSVFSAEIEPFPCALLANRYPDVPNLGDMTKLHGADLAQYGARWWIAGTPCQDFSVAGLRAGLEARLEHYQLMDKTPRAMSRDDLCALAQAFADCLHGFTLPAWKDDALIIPRTAPAKYKSWLFADNFAAAAETLQNCGATETQLATALGQNWREILERRKSNGMPLKQSQREKDSK